MRLEWMGAVIEQHPGIIITHGDIGMAAHSDCVVVGDYQRRTAFPTTGLVRVEDLKIPVLPQDSGVIDSVRASWNPDVA